MDCPSCYTLLIPCRKFGPPYLWVRLKQPQEQRSDQPPCLTSACWVFSCFHNQPNSDMDYTIVNVRAHAIILMHVGGVTLAVGLKLAQWGRAWELLLVPAIHWVSVRLTPYCTSRSISSFSWTLLYASSRSIAAASVCSFLWNPSYTAYANATAFFHVHFPLVDAVLGCMYVLIRIRLLCLWSGFCRRFP